MSYVPIETSTGRYVLLKVNDDVLLRQRTPTPAVDVQPSASAASLSSAAHISEKLDDRTANLAPNLFDGHVAIVTGAARGIGEAVARRLAAMGAAVVITDIDKVQCDQVALFLRNAGKKSLSFPGDITKAGFADELVNVTMKEFGRLTLLVNNAGYTRDKMLHKMSDEQFQEMLNIHLLAVFRLIRAASPYMRDAAKKEIAESGHALPRSIVNISSVSGLHGNVGQVNYAAAKMGILGLTKTVAKEFGPFNIRCNSVAFGFIETRLTALPKKVSVGGKEVLVGIPKNEQGEAFRMAATPMKRKGSVDDAAGAVCMMLSPWASFITGHCLECSGGYGI